MYSNPYIQNYNSNLSQQNLNDRIDSEIAKLQQMKNNINQQLPPAINQTFQLAPNNQSMRYANTIDEVDKETIYSDTPFFSKDMSILWIKNLNGDIKTYELNEVVLKDEKDIKIDFLMAQISELKKGMMKYEHDANLDGSIEDEKSPDVSTISKSTKKQK